jgi:hypothetical protein
LISAVGQLVKLTRRSSAPVSWSMPAYCRQLAQAGIVDLLCTCPCEAFGVQHEVGPDGLVDADFEGSTVGIERRSDLEIVMPIG